MANANDTSPFASRAPRLLGAQIDSLVRADKAAYAIKSIARVLREYHDGLQGDCAPFNANVAGGLIEALELLSSDIYGEAAYVLRSVGRDEFGDKLSKEAAA